MTTLERRHLSRKVREIAEHNNELYKLTLYSGESNVQFIGNYHDSITGGSNLAGRIQVYSGIGDLADAVCLPVMDFPDYTSESGCHFFVFNNTLFFELYDKKGVVQ